MRPVQAWRRLLAAFRQGDLGGQSLLYIAGAFLQNVATYVLVPALAAFLAPEDFGVIGTLIPFGWFLAVFLGLGLSSAIVRFLGEQATEEAKARFAATLLVFQAALSLAAILALNLAGPLLWPRLTAGSIPFDPCVRLMLWTVFGDVVLLQAVALHVARSEAGRVFRLNLLKSVLAAALILLLVAGLDLHARGVMLGQCAASLLTAAWAFGSALRRSGRFSPDWGWLGRSLAFGLPLVPHAAFWILLSVASRAILERHATLADLGFFNFGYSIGMMILPVALGIQQAWVPRYYRIMREDPDAAAKVERFAGRYLSAIALLGVSGILFAPDVLAALLPATYRPAIPYVAPVLAGYILVGFSFLDSAALSHHHRTKVFPAISATAAALNIGLNLWAVHHGPAVAVWAVPITFAAYALLFRLAARGLPGAMPRPGPTLALALLSLAALAPALLLEPLAPAALAAKAVFLAACAAAALRSWPAAGKKDSIDVDGPVDHVKRIIISRLPHRILSMCYHRIVQRRQMAAEERIARRMGMRDAGGFDWAGWKRGDTLFILGGGPSVNLVPPERWAAIGRRDSIGFNLWIKHDFVPRMYFVHMLPPCVDARYYVGLMDPGRNVERYRRVPKFMPLLWLDGEARLLEAMPPEWRRDFLAVRTFGAVARSPAELDRELDMLARTGLLTADLQPMRLFSYINSVSMFLHLAVRLGYKRVVLCGVDFQGTGHFYDKPQANRVLPFDFTRRRRGHLMAREVILCLHDRLLRPRGVELFVENAGSALHPDIPLAPDSLFR